MSIQTDCNRKFSLAAYCSFALTAASGLIGCSAESQPTAPSASLSPPLTVAAAPRMSDDPISRPYLTDLDVTRPNLIQTNSPSGARQSSSKPGSYFGVTSSLVAMQFGDQTALVQQTGSPRIEIVPTPDPDPVGPEDFRNWPIPDVTLFVTGRQHGYIEPCGCTGLDRQKGGMARRMTFLRQLRDQGWTVLPIDGGDQVRRIGTQAEIKLQFIARAMQEMGYQAVGFGPDDLRLGVGELLSVAAADNPDDALYVSANVVLIDPTLVSRSKVVERNGHRIGLTSILDPASVQVPAGDDVAVQPIVTAAREALAELRDNRATFRVLLFYGEEDAARQLVQEVTGFELVVVAGGYGEPTFQPLAIEGSATRMILTGNKGMYAGLVGLYRDQPLKYARVALTHEFPDAAEMRQLMGDYQAQLKAIGLEGIGLLPPVPHSSGKRFVGTAVCGECHTSALEVWEGSAHADATIDIVKPPKERGDIARHFDPECLSCHVTGWNPQEYFPYESGYLSLETTAHLTGNGCENCHGPGSDHAAAEAGDLDVTDEQRDQLRDSMKLPLAKAREKCMECHDLDNSPDFHVDGAFEEIYWPEVAHEGKD